MASDGALEDDFCVALNGDGSIEGSLEALDTSTRCYDGAIRSRRADGFDELRRDCALAASPLLPQDTFWIGAGAKPRCALEALALEIYAFHASASPLRDASASGAEWWAQVKAPGAVEEADREVGFHWDKDEAAHACHGMYVFPALSTVTYLTDGGAPTVILRRTPDPFSGDVSPAPIDGAEACWPASGRHLAFDGRLLHAAPAALAASGWERRVTFLVNVWLGHRPSGIRPFPDAALDKMSAADPEGGDRLASASLAAAAARAPSAAAPSLLDEDRPRPPPLVFPFSKTGTRHVVRLALPFDATRVRDDDPGIVDLAALGCEAAVGIEAAIAAAAGSAPPPAKRPRVA